MKSVQIRSYFWSVLSPNTGKFGPETTPYLDTFHAVNLYKNNQPQTWPCEFLKFLEVVNMKKWKKLEIFLKQLNFGLFKRVF